MTGLHKTTPIIKIIVLLLFTVIFISSNTPSAFAALDPDDSTYISVPSEYELERMAPRTELDMLTTNLAGENISLADGGLTFSVTDISIPTNMGINVDITRSYNRLNGDKE